MARSTSLEVDVIRWCGGALWKMVGWRVGGGGRDGLHRQLHIMMEGVVCIHDDDDDGRSITW